MTTDAGTTQPAGTPAPMPLFHYVITLQWETLSGITAATIAGPTRPAPGQTRGDVFNDLLAYAKREMGTEEAVVLFYCLEPAAL